MVLGKARGGGGGAGLTREERAELTAAFEQLNAHKANIDLLVSRLEEEDCEWTRDKVCTTVAALVSCIAIRQMLAQDALAGCSVRSLMDCITMSPWQCTALSRSTQLLDRVHRVPTQVLRSLRGLELKFGQLTDNQVGADLI